MKMINYRITLQYDGSRYKGWQKQKNTDMTIQGKVEQVLEKMCGEPIEVHGSGRTDAGAHAKEQVANFHLNGAWDKDEILTYLNEYLPEDIAVTAIAPADERFHSRLSAISKTYVYRIHTSVIPDVFQRKYMYTICDNLDVDAMKKAALQLTGEHDFKAFCGNRHMKKSTVRIIYKIDIEETEHEISIAVMGNGFLQNMVRILVGTLVEVGKGEKRADEMESILESKNRELAGVTMPAQGLILEKVSYEKMDS